MVVTCTDFPIFRFHLLNLQSPSMPPRLPLQRARGALICSHRSSQPFASYLLPLFAPQQQRAASILSSLSDVASAYSKRIRRGRGPSSGKGKTSGRGHKGQKQHGKVPYLFNGGQTKDEVVSGTRGFDNQCVNPSNCDHPVGVEANEGIGSRWKCQR
jgi:hypothetical protein